MPESWQLPAPASTQHVQGGHMSKEASLSHRWGQILQASRELPNITNSFPVCHLPPRIRLLVWWQFGFFFFFPRCSLSFVEWTPKNLALGLTVAYGRCCTYLSKLSAVLQPVGMPQEKIVSLLCERTWNSWSKTTFPLENLSQKRPHMCNDTSKSSPRLMTVSSACAFQNHREGWQHVDCSCCSCLGYASLLTCSHRWHCSLHLSLEGCDCNRLP